jgi:Na+-transporting methylmalonyl-CoA/oxaloacetate decarboxylase gamma subunit
MEACMDNCTFGITMLVCGMGGTILTLWIMSLVMTLLGKLFPEKPATKED